MSSIYGFRKEERVMSKLRILDDVVVMVGRVDRLAAVIGRRNRSLADQLRRASMSVGLNAAEGMHARGKKRLSQLDIAMGSGRESIMALRMAGAIGLLDAETVAAEADDIDRIVATLYKLAHRKQ